MCLNSTPKSVKMTPVRPQKEASRIWKCGSTTGWGGDREHSAPVALLEGGAGLICRGDKGCVSHPTITHYTDVHFTVAIGEPIRGRNMSRCVLSIYRCPRSGQGRVVHNEKSLYSTCSSAAQPARRIIPATSTSTSKARTRTCFSWK